MSRPIYEPSLQRTDARLGYGTNQLFRRPAPNAGCCPAWICVYDGGSGYIGQPYNSATTGGTSDLLYPYVDWSENSADIFTYEANSGGSLGTTYSYLPVIKVDGVYSFTLATWCEDLTAVEFRIKWSLPFSGTGKYVGMASADKPLKAQEYYNFTNFPTSYFYFDRTWTIAFKVGTTPPITVAPFITGGGASGGNFTATLRNRLWITYHGPVEYAGTAFATDNDPGPP